MKIDGIAIRRTYIEVPPMDERKWDKVPGIPADVFLADMEDSVAPDLKEKARDKVVALVKDPGYFDGREFICRPNNINTQWGRDDLEAIAEVQAPFVLYPKPRTAEEVREVLSIFEKHGSIPELVLLVETPHTVVRLEEIASVPGVAGLMFGPGDLALESGVALLDGQEAFKDGFLYPRSKTVMVARMLGLEASEGLFLANLKDLETVRAGAVQSKLMGFSGNMSFYPPHVEIINEVRTPSATDVAWSKRVIEAYSEAKARGQGAVTVDGRWLTVHQFTEAQQALRLAQILGAA